MKRHNFKQRKSYIFTFILVFTLLLQTGCVKTLYNERERNTNGSTIFMSYAAPVFPLVIQDNSKDVIATRELIFDFNYFGDTKSPTDFMLLEHSDIKVFDNYTLTNTTTEDNTVRIFYPFVSSFPNLERLLPAITVSGNFIDVKLLAGIAPDYPNTWTFYSELLSDGNYLNNAMADPVELNQTVFVYEFTNTQTNNKTAIAPTLAASFNLDYDNTTVLSYGFNGGEFNAENEFMRRSFFLERRNEQSRHLVVLGDDIENLTIQGYKDGGCNKGDEIERTTDIRRYEAVLSDILEILFDNFMGIYANDTINNPHINADSTDLLFKTVIETLDLALKSEHGARRIFFGGGDLEDVFSSALSSNRVFYLTADLSIPAGESVALNIEMMKAGSYDFYMKGEQNIGLYGFDLLTNFIFGIVFESTTAELRGIENIDIVLQNIGFNRDNGILNVSLDSETPHYFIEVRQAANN